MFFIAEHGDGPGRSVKADLADRRGVEADPAHLFDEQDALDERGPLAAVGSTKLYVRDKKDILALELANSTE